MGRRRRPSGGSHGDARAVLPEGGAGAGRRVVFGPHARDRVPRRRHRPVQPVVTEGRSGGRLVVRGLTDVRSVREILWPAFTAAGAAGAAGAAELDYRQDVDMWRLRAAVAGAQPADRPDVLLVADPVLF